MITKLEALFFKGFKHIEIKLKDYNVLVGPNASGKSSFLDILTFFKDVLNDGPIRAVELRCADFRELVWNREKDYFELALEIKLPTTIQTNYQKCRYELRISFDSTNGIIIENEALWFIRGKNNSVKQKKKEEQLYLFPEDKTPPPHIITQSKRTPTGWRKIVSKSERGNDFFRSETSDWNIVYRFGPKKASLARIPEDENKFPLAIWVKNLLMEGIQYIQLNSTEMKYPCRPDASVYFEPDGSNLPKVIKHLKEESFVSFTRWADHVKTALPDIEEIEVKERPEDRFLYIYIKYKNDIIVPSWLLSDGTLRLLALTIIPYLPEKEKIYIIEEPENGLHPLAIESVIQSLSSVYEGQVFLATHSPIILQLSEPKDILCFAKTESGTIDVIRGEEHPILKDWKREVDLATLYASGVLQ